MDLLDALNVNHINKEEKGFASENGRVYGAEQTLDAVICIK